MSLASVCLWTLARTVALGLAAWPVAVGIERTLRNQSGANRSWMFAALFAPCLFPELLVGYAYREAALLSPSRAEWLCAGLLLIRIIPVGVVVLLSMPASFMSDAAIHCRWMLVRTCPWSLNEWWRLVSCYWHGPIRRGIPAMGLMSLVAFQEFELAALLQTTSWTDWFVAAQRVGLNRDEMLLQTLWPLGMQLPLVIGALNWLSRQNSSQSEQLDEMLLTMSRSANIAVTLYLGVALTCGFLIPLGIVAWKAPGGFGLLVRQTSQWAGLGHEILISTAVSLCAGLTTWYAVIVWFNSKKSGLWSYTIMLLFVLSGLFGSLLLSLATGILFQNRWLRPFYDTPIPWLLTLGLWLLPRAILLQVWLRKMVQSESVHLAEMLNNPDLLFRLRDQPRLLAMSLLCYWAYLDLPTAFLLAPTGMESGLVRLYNFMHFGRSAALSAESMVFFGMPIVAMCLVWRLVLAIRHWGE